MDFEDSEPAQFGAVEYLVILSMLALSLVIGVYFTFWSRQDSYNDYMLGGRKMGVFPVAMSQVASHISGLAIVGNPAEVYSYGTLYSVVLLTDPLVPLINIYLFLPIFYNLQLNSLFEYLELRFSHGTRVLGSSIYAISQLIYLPAIVYVPALVLNQVSGVSVQLVAAVICAICIVYTTFGGIKAVLWTDSLQNMFSLVGVLFVVYLGFVQLGGPSQIVRTVQEGDRLEFFKRANNKLVVLNLCKNHDYKRSMEVSPFVRNSFWSMTIGNFGNWLSFLAVHPGAVQRCLSVSTFSKAKRVLLWTMFGVMLVHLICSVLGMILYARYHGCDPIATGEIKKTGQLLPLYVIEVSHKYPGLAGLFVSGVLSAAFSSMSSSLNTMAGVFYEDIVEFALRGKKLSDAKQSVIMKAISLLLGVVCVCLVLMVDKTDSLFQISISLSGITNGALLTFFIMGIFIPKANSKGVITGAATSVVVMALIVGKAQYYFATGKLKYPGKYTSIDQCPHNYTASPEVLSRLETHHGYSSPVVADPSVPLIYQMSYLYYTLCGTLVGLSVATIVSLVTQSPDWMAIDRRLLSPYVTHFLPQKRPKSTTSSRSSSVRFADEELKVIKFTSVPTEEDKAIE